MKDVLYRIKENSLFKGLVICIIILSALLLGTATYDLSPQVVSAIIFLDYFITIFFCVEILIRFAAEKNKKEFFQDGWNVFDTIIVTVSLIPAGESALLLRLIVDRSINTIAFKISLCLPFTFYHSLYLCGLWLNGFW